MSDLGSHWIDLPFWALKLEAPRTDRGVRPAAAPRDRPGLDARRLRIRRARRAAARHADLVPGRATSPSPGRRARSRSGTAASCSSARRGCSCPTTAGTSSCPRRSSATSSRPSRPSRSRSATTPSGSTPARPGAPTTCHFDYAGWLTEANHLGNVAYRVGKKLEWDAGEARTPATPPRPSGSSGASTARAGH